MLSDRPPTSIVLKLAGIQFGISSLQIVFNPNSVLRASNALLQRLRISDFALVILILMFEQSATEEFSRIIK